MKIQILSDLHLEFGIKLSIPQTNADIIILAGDIATGTDGVKWAIQESNRLDKPILYIFGNHEFYNNDYVQVLEESFKCVEHSNVIILHNHSYNLNGVIFLGSTFWTDFEGLGKESKTEALIKANVGLNDYFRISYMKRLLSSGDTLQFNYKAKEWLNSSLLEYKNFPKVVITHHGLFKECQDIARYGAPNLFSLNFWSDLEQTISYDSNIKLFVYGHTHSNLRFKIRDVCVTTNQFGYPHELVPGFVLNYIVEI